MRNGQNVGSSAVASCEGDSCGYFKQAPLPKARARSVVKWSRARRPMRDEFDQFCAFHGSSACSNYLVGQTGRAICTATFAISWGTTGRRCCGHICGGVAFSLSLLPTQLCGNYYTCKGEAMCCAIDFCTTERGRWFGPFQPQTLI